MLLSRRIKKSGDSFKAMSKKDKFLLTVSVNLQDLAEFSVATDLLGQRTNTAFVYQFMMQKVREAKLEVSESKFTELVESKKLEILDRSNRKAKEREKKSRKVLTTREKVTYEDETQNEKIA